MSKLVVQNTPTPWTEFIAHSNYHSGICSKGAKPIALVCKGTSYEEANANAALIVRAVNSHEELVRRFRLALNDLAAMMHVHATVKENEAFQHYIESGEKLLAKAEAL